MEIGISETLLRLGSAMLMAAVLGFERQMHNKPAGLRTHMLVSLGSAMFTLVTLQLAAGEFNSFQNVRLDPIRTIAGIVGGIGFLGAGTILQSRGNVEGITTAAALWIMAAVGTACGAGYYLEAGVATTLTFVAVVGLGWLSHRISGSEPPSAP